MFRKFVSVIAAVAVVAPLMATEWCTDFEAAKARAAEQHKAVLIDFTGSDWCGCCIQLRKTVLDTPAFATYAQDKFVCMEVDMPRHKKQAPKLAAQNKGICEKYDARMFPTVLVVSPEGDVLGGFIGARSSVDSIKEPLDAAFDNLGKLRTAREAQGVDRARALMDIYRSIPPELKNAADPYQQEIAALDPDNVTGIHAKGDTVPYRDFMRKVDSAGNDFPRVLAMLDERIALGIEEEKPDLLRLKGMTLIVSANTEEELLQAKELLLEAASLMGGTRQATALQDYVARNFGDTAALLDRVKQQREDNQRAASATEADSYIAKIKEKGLSPKLAIADLNAQLIHASNAQKAEILRLKGTVLLHFAETEEDLYTAKLAFLQAAALMGDTPEASELRGYVDKTFSSPSQLLDQLKKER